MARKRTIKDIPPYRPAFLDDSDIDGTIQLMYGPPPIVEARSGVPVIVRPDNTIGIVPSPVNTTRSLETSAALLESVSAPRPSAPPDNTIKTVSSPDSTVEGESRSIPNRVVVITQPLAGQDNTIGIVSSPVNTIGLASNRETTSNSLPSTPDDTVDIVSSPVNTIGTVLTPDDTIRTESEPGTNETFLATVSPDNTAATVPSPVKTIDIVSTPDSTIKVSARRATSIPASHPPDNTINTVLSPTTPDSTISSVSTGDNTSSSSLFPQPSQIFLPKTKKRLFKPRMPSDVHTDAEDRLYRFMRNAGRPVSPGVREFAGNMTVLGKQMGRDDRSVRRIVQSLIEKLSIAIGTPENFRTGICRTYLVYEYDLAQERRIAAGLVYAIKNKGIALLTEDQAQELMRCEFATVSTPDNTTPDDTIRQTVLTPDNTPVSSPDNTVVQSADNTHAHPYIRNRSFKKATTEEKTTSSTNAGPPAEVVSAIRRIVGRCDDQAANSIVRKCRTFAPEAPDEHIVVAIDTIAAEIRGKKGTVETPMGYLIQYVPPFFEGESYRQFVADEDRRKRLAREEDIKSARMILADGDGNEELLQWARMVLSERGSGE